GTPYRSFFAIPTARASTANLRHTRECQSFRNWLGVRESAHAYKRQTAAVLLHPLRTALRPDDASPSASSRSRRAILLPARRRRIRAPDRVPPPALARSSR